MLSEISESDADMFCGILKKEFNSVSIISYIKTSLAWKQKNKKFDVSLLFIKEKMESGVFIGIMRSGCKMPMITVYAFDNYETELKQCLLQCPIDWKNKICCKELLAKHLPILTEVLEQKNCRLCEMRTVLLMYMPIEDALKIEIECPDDVEFGPILPHHLPDIYDQWTARLKDTFSIDQIRNCLHLNQESAVGVFKKKSELLLSRCLRSPLGDIMALQTIETAQKKGYAKLLIKKVTKILAEHSIQPFARTIEPNTSSIATFQAVGYKIFENVLSFYIQPV